MRGVGIVATGRWMMTRARLQKFVPKELKAI
jgi:hypothetical protein